MDKTTIPEPIQPNPEPVKKRRGRKPKAPKVPSEEPVVIRAGTKQILFD